MSLDERRAKQLMHVLDLDRTPTQARVSDMFQFTLNLEKFLTSVVVNKLWSVLPLLVIVVRAGGDRKLSTNEDST